MLACLHDVTATLTLFCMIRGAGLGGGTLGCCGSGCMGGDERGHAGGQRQFSWRRSQISSRSKRNSSHPASLLFSSFYRVQQLWAGPCCPCCSPWRPVCIGACVYLCPLEKKNLAWQRDWHCLVYLPIEAPMSCPTNLQSHGIVLICHDPQSYDTFTIAIENTVHLSFHVYRHIHFHLGSWNDITFTKRTL